MTALLLSLLANATILALAGIAVIRSEKLRKLMPPPPAAETVVTIVPEQAPPMTAVGNAEARQRFARTSPDQAAEKPTSAPFIGERDTRATSERKPMADAPPLPSQAGITPRDEGHIETTESDYRDGSLDTAAEPAVPSPPQPSPPPSPVAHESTAAAAASLPPPREELLAGPHPVDVPVPRETAPEETIKATPEIPAPPAEAEMPQAAKPVEETPPEPEKPRDPAFSGNQRKTALVGSISRTGRSALDVADTPLGRYQAALSRAVEQEWQRNCVRHRDFITPGFLTVRFFVEPSGRVRSVQFVGDMETGEVQKGFTLNSIRDAEIPPMPSALRREYAQEPLELIFRFYF